MNKNKHGYYLIIVLSILALFLPVSNAKSQFTYYTYLPLIHKENASWINLENRAESLAFYQTNYLIENPPPINWSGSHANCDPGTTSPAFQQAVLQRINYFRAMAGVPAEITFSDESNIRAQAAALLISVNNASNHNPPDTWTCYSTLAYEGTCSSNLYLGVFGWDAITGYMKDPGDTNGFVGHRRQILRPQTKIMGTGDIPPTTGYSPSNALRVFDEHMWDPRPQTRDGFVAWPPPGYVPYPVVFTRWSISYPEAEFGNATVSMREEGKLLTTIVESVVDGYAENTLVWQIQGMSCGQNWPRPNQDTRYTISINNVIINSQPQNFTYDVIVFDPDH
jgi:uncharacterized protein YkwD